MTKSDLKTGMRVTYRNGQTAIVLLGCDFSGAIASGENELFVNHKTQFWMRLDTLENDLTYPDDETMDIIKIEIPDHPYEIFEEFGNYVTAWVRQEPKLITIAEIEKLLGYPFKIVETKP